MVLKCRGFAPGFLYHLVDRHSGRYRICGWSLHDKGWRVSPGVTPCVRQGVSQRCQGCHSLVRHDRRLGPRTGRSWPVFEAVSYTARMVLLVVEHVAAFAERCILAVCVAPPSNTGGIFGRRVGTWTRSSSPSSDGGCGSLQKGLEAPSGVEPEIEVLQACRTA